MITDQIPVDKVYNETAHQYYNVYLNGGTYDNQYWAGEFFTNPYKPVMRIKRERLKEEYEKAKQFAIGKNMNGEMRIGWS